MPTTGPEELPDDVPESLQMMAAVVANAGIDHPYYRAFEELLKKDPVAFAKRHSDLEKSYWDAKASPVGGEVSGTKPGAGEACGLCGEVYWPAGCERALEAGKEWLERNRDS